MVPIYAFASWLSLRFKDHSLYIDLVRDCYEALVIYCFVSMLINYAGGEKKLLDILEKHGKMHHMAPLSFFLPSFKTDRKFLLYCKRAVLQYVYVKPFTAVLAIVLDEMDLFDEGKWSWNRGYGYTVFINNVAVTVAMYGLLYFYHAIAEALHEIKPLAKLLCIKAVLFLSFWQGVVISIMDKFGMIHESAYNSLSQVETELQDFLICIEMFGAALAHDWAYSYIEFAKTNQKRKHFGLLNVLNLGDMFADTYATFFKTKSN